MKNLWITLIPILAISCGKILGEEVARIEVNGVSSQQEIAEAETTVRLYEGDEIGFWSDMSLEYRDGDEFWWEVEILLEGEPHSNLKIDPLDKDLTVNSTETNFNGEITTAYSGRNLMMTIGETGEYRVRSRLFTTSETAVVKKAALVVKKH